LIHSSRKLSSLRAAKFVELARRAGIAVYREARTVISRQGALVMGRVYLHSVILILRLARASSLAIKVLLIGLVLASCNKSNHSEELLNEMSSLKLKIEDLESHVSELRREISAKDHNRIWLSPDSKGFQRLDSHLGSFYVSLLSIKEYADGYKVALRVGNPTLAEFADPTFIIEWGSRDIAEFLKSKNTKSETIKKTLRPGSWNTVEIIIGPASKDQIGTISLKMEISSVSLVGR